MAIRTALRVEIPNRTGELARVLRPIAQSGVNLHALAGMTCAQSGVIELLPSDMAAAADSLQQAGVSAREVTVVLVWLPNRPGTLLRACEALATAEINLQSAYVVSTDPTLGVQVTLECSDANRADQVLSEFNHPVGAR